MALLDGPGFLRNTIIPSIGGTSASAKRIPFAFTSTLRLMQAGKVDALGTEFAKIKSQRDVKTELADIEKQTRGTNVAAQMGLSGLIENFNGAQQSVVGVKMPVIAMAVNPQTIGWTQNKRIVKRDTMTGSTFFHFTDSDDQNNDILTMSFSGKTGNINTNVSFADMLNNNSNLRLRTWHELYNLSREAMLLNRKNTGKEGIPAGIKNEFFISYRTVLFPVQITLIGFFNKVLEFRESADDPNNRDYSFDFVVTRTSPSLDDMARIVSTSLTTVGQSQSLISNITAGSDRQLNASGIANSGDLIGDV